MKKMTAIILAILMLLSVAAGVEGVLNGLLRSVDLRAGSLPLVGGPRPGDKSGLTVRGKKAPGGGTDVR